MSALTSTDLKTIFTEKIQKLPEVARVEEYDSKSGKYTIIFPYSDISELYSENGLDFVNLLNKMTEVGLKSINHQLETIESQDLSDKDFEEFIIIDSEKNFVITFTDDSGIFNPKLESKAEKKEPNRDVPNADLHLIARKEYIQDVRQYITIRKELEEFQKQKNFDYTREIDTKLQDLKKIKENLIPELRQIDEKNTEILAEIQNFIDSFEKYLEEKDNNFIFFHASVSNDSKKLISAIEQYTVILGNTKEPSEKVKIDNYISMLTELLGKLESSVKETLEALD